MTQEPRSSAAAPGPVRLLDPSSRIQVYFQGILDGACFLYAPANAYKALTGKRVSREHWNRAIAVVPDPGAFLGGSGATELPVEEAERVLAAVLVELADPGETFVIERLDASAGIPELGDEVSADSVVVFAYGGPSEFQHPETHIVCGVAASKAHPATVHVACSTAFWGRYLQGGEYTERHHPDLHRWSNDSISADQPLTIAPSFRWRITLSTADGGSGRVRAE